MSRQPGTTAQQTPQVVGVQSLISGGFEDGAGPAFEVRNPARPSDLVAHGHAVADHQVLRALASSSSAFVAWKQTRIAERAAVLQRAARLIEDQAQDLARLLTREEGKTLAESTAEVDRTVATLRFYAAVGHLLGGQTLSSGALSQMLFTKREPLGVVVLVTPWNFPLAIPTQKLAPALIAGNAVILKPSSLTPTIAFRLIEALMNAGAPPGTVSMVVGPGGTVGRQLAESDQVAGLSFTGSAEVGHRLAEVVRGHGARIQLEMGGKNPLLVLADADLDLAVDVAARGAFGLTGQSCTATGRIFVEQAVHSSFVTRLVARASAIRVGDGLELGSDMGPKVAEREAAIARTQVETALEHGDAVLRHRSTLIAETIRTGGYFVPPVVLDDVRPDSEVGSQELFSPVACVTPVASFEAGVKACNSGRYALAASICTTSLSASHRFVDEVEAGVVKVNGSTTGLEIQMPFGGFKESGDGVHKELGMASFDFYTRLKSVYLSYPAEARRT